MIVGLSICCLILILWIIIWAFFAFTDDETDTPDWDRICKIAMSNPTEEQKEKVKELRKKFLKVQHLDEEDENENRRDDEKRATI